MVKSAAKSDASKRNSEPTKRSQRPATAGTDATEALVALRTATVAFANEDADSEATLRLALDHLIAVTGADAGAVAIPGETGLPDILAERFVDELGPMSMTALDSALRATSAEASITDPPASASVLSSSITSILCTPVRRRGKTLAAVYLDRRGGPSFDETARNLAISFASMLALSLDLTRRVERVEGQAAEARAEAAHLSGHWRFGSLATRNQVFAECLQLAERAATTDTTLLMLGETGSGKEHVARCVHAASPRSAGPFLAVNCAAIPESLIESELFGHERGAFTGAVETRRGQFEMADGGTLFLDEVGDLPLSVQPKLLRVLEDKMVTRVGGQSSRRVDVRIIGATHKDLRGEVDAERFREDLYYRLDVVTVRVPALRERTEDIPTLARAFLEAESSRQHRKLSLSEAAIRRLMEHPWPGNVRELKNTMERLCVLAEGPVLEAVDVDARLPKNRGAPPAPDSSDGRRSLKSRLKLAERRIDELSAAVEGLRAERGRARPKARATAGTTETKSTGGKPSRGNGALRASSSDGTLKKQLEAATRQILLEALEEAGSVAGAARRLRISRQSLSVKCRQLGIRRSPEFESNGDMN